MPHADTTGCSRTRDLALDSQSYSSRVTASPPHPLTPSLPLALTTTGERPMLRTALLFTVLTLLPRLALAQYGDIRDVKLAKPEDKEDVKSTPAPEGATVLFD